MTKISYFCLIKMFLTYLYHSMISIQFPVDPHVQKYLIKKIGPQLDVSQKSFYSKMISDILSQKHFASKPATVKATFYEVLIPDYIIFDWNSGMSLNKSNYQEFNTRVDALFRHDLTTYCEMWMNDMKIIDVVRKFLKYYDLSPDDINEESLCRYLRRKGIVRKKRTKKEPRVLSVKNEGLFQEKSTTVYSDSNSINTQHV
ncbi:MAG: hypothetical protein ACPGSD_00030 [Flavobacteriales bacterium]